MTGARRVQKELLNKYPAPDLRVYVIWFSMVPTDARAAWRWTGNVITDPRVAHYWDDRKVVGRWLAKKDNQFADDSDVVWDAFFLYGPDAKWTDEPQPLIVRGATVIDEFDQLQKNLVPLMEELGKRSRNREP